MDQPVAKHVHDRLALLQHNVADKRLKAAVFRGHIHENTFTENRLEALDLDTDGTTHGAVGGRLGCQFKLDVPSSSQS